jgi:hypothetical protein
MRQVCCSAYGEAIGHAFLSRKSDCLPKNCSDIDLGEAVA